MKLLEDKILSEATTPSENVLKVDTFLNYQIDVAFIDELAAEWKRLFADEHITKIVTIESSGIGIACLTARHFGVPVVFAKKTAAFGYGNDDYQCMVTSYTHGTTYSVVIRKNLISENDRILIIDDLLANGSAIRALISICKSAKAKVVGVGVAIEKAYQGGADKIRELGYRVESLAKIKSINENGITFE